MDREPALEVGIGDDAAVISGLNHQRLLVSSDTLVESVHFPRGADSAWVARRALRVNLSDMAAMGAQPVWFMLALTLPEANERWLQGFSAGLSLDSQEFGCELIGGDTTKGPLNIGIQMMGLVPESRSPLLRCGAQQGDLLVVTGTLGDAGAALRLDLNSFDTETRPLERYLLQRYWLPSPRQAFAIEAADCIHAACDISDGLMADVGHLCKQSQLAATIQMDAIPLSPQLQEFDSHARRNALTSGDDYELCMAVPENKLSDIQAVAEKQGIAVSVVGRFESAKNGAYKVSVKDTQGQILDIETAGYTHF